MPFAMVVIRKLFPLVEKLIPVLAHQWAFNLFFKPIRFPRPQRELPTRQSATKFRMNVGSMDIQCYSWGQGPVVLFVHGWAGRGTQFFKFVQPFVEKGFKVVTFDGPAHGESSGKSTNIIEFHQVLASMEEYYREICAVVTHSFGGAATIFAMSEGLKVQNLINIGSPSSGHKIISEFLKKINGSPRVAGYFDQLVREKFDRSFDSFSSEVLVKRLPTFNLLLIHDKNDKEVGIEQAEKINALMPGSEIMVTSLLGHTRILRDDQVVNKSLAFVMEKNRKPELMGT